MTVRMRTAFFLLAVLAVAQTAPVRAQALLEEVSVYAAGLGLNTIPDHGDELVAFLDYRNAGYGIYAVEVASGTTHELQRVYYAEPEVATYARRVAWIGYTESGQPDVYVHDAAETGARRITDDAAFQNHPDLHGDLLVWQDYRDGGPLGLNADIYLHDLTTGTTAPVAAAEGYQDLPSVHGTRIVWQDYRHAGPLLETAEIYAFDRATGEARRLTNGSAYRTNPHVWQDRVVWEDYRNAERGDIYLYDFATGEERPISTFPAHKTEPVVFGDWILWLDYRNSTDQGDLFGYHLETGEEYPLLVHPAHQAPPHLFERHVVWQDYRNGVLDLWSGLLRDPEPSSAERPADIAEIALTAAPNPFKDATTIHFEEPAPAGTRFDLYDVTGRGVWQAHVAPGARSITWTGRSGSGAAVPAGVYVGMLTAPRSVANVLIVRL